MLSDKDFPIGHKANFPVSNVSHLASNLPKTSGVYLFKNNRQKVLYVGKAKNLRARVSSYFSQFEGAVLNSKTKILVNKIVSFEVILTANETEALLLENSLIKKLSPPYNINLNDAAGDSWLSGDGTAEGVHVDATGYVFIGDDPD